MPRYRCKRKCYVGTRIFKEGVIYTLDKTFQSNHHFKMLGGFTTPDVEEVDDAPLMVEGDSPEEGAESGDYSELNVKALKKLARDRGIEIEGNRNRANLIAALEFDDAQGGGVEEEEEGESGGSLLAD